MKDGHLLDVNNISPGFKTKNLTSVRVKNMSQDKQTKFKQTLYNVPLKAIYGGMVIIDVPNAK